jgi:hypothetical protein
MELVGCRPSPRRQPHRLRRIATRVEARTARLHSGSSRWPGGTTDGAGRGHTGLCSWSSATGTTTAETANWEATAGAATAAGATAAAAADVADAAADVADAAAGATGAAAADAAAGTDGGDACEVGGNGSDGAVSGINCVPAGWCESKSSSDPVRREGISALDRGRGTSIRPISRRIGRRDRRVPSIFSGTAHIVAEPRLESESRGRRRMVPAAVLVAVMAAPNHAIQHVPESTLVRRVLPRCRPGAAASATRACTPRVGVPRAQKRPSSPMQRPRMSPPK